MDTERNTEVNDEILIRGFIKGSLEDFDLLYERHKRSLYLYLSRFLPGDKATTDDLFQQTWLKVIALLPRYEERERFPAWLMRIAHNLAMDHFRRMRRNVEESFEDSMVERLPSASESPLQGIQNEELGKAISGAVAELPPELREVFLMRQSGIAFREIADIQGCSINTALARMQYALKRLRKSLAGWEDNGKGGAK